MITIKKQTTHNPLNPDGKFIASSHKLLQALFAKTRKLFLIMLATMLAYNHSSAQSVAAAGNHSFSLCSSPGIPKANGWNGDGQLGDGTTINRATPVSASGISSITAITGGLNYSLFLKNGGTSGLAELIPMNNWVMEHLLKE